MPIQSVRTSPFKFASLPGCLVSLSTIEVTDDERLEEGNCESLNQITYHSSSVLLSPYCDNKVESDFIYTFLLCLIQPKKTKEKHNAPIS